MLFSIVNIALPQSEVDYLCFEVTEGTTISLEKIGDSNPEIYYSFDKNVWNSFSSLTVLQNCMVYFKGSNLEGFSKDVENYSKFIVSKEFKCSGNIMTLIDGVGETVIIPNKCCFYELFYYSKIVTAPKLPATSLCDSCYYYMFYHCTSLTIAPELPAITLANGCYEGMFSGCTSLKTAPALPATTLADYCYCGMFTGCSLTTAPDLPAKNLAKSCYALMFCGCLNLTTPPVLPATSLANGCYAGMFEWCSNLTTAPELPATFLTRFCYEAMFLGCTNLTIAPKLPSTDLAYGCYEAMFENCTSLITAPELPAINLTEFCYKRMFLGCENLRNAPNLKAQSLNERCYEQMFVGCVKLSKIIVGFVDWVNGVNSDAWVQDVSFNGFFICPKGLEQKYGDTYIPIGWIVNYLFNITIPKSSKNYISISETTNIESGTEISFSVADRTSEGLFAIVTVQGANPIETTQSGNDCTFTMPEEDVTINVSYTPIKYSITTDEYSSAVAEACVGETVNVTFATRPGYNLTSATYNGNALTITNGAASFTMPSANVTIATTYTPIVYNITTDQYITADKATATINDQVTFTVADRSAEGLLLEKVLINNAVFSGRSFDVKDYLQDVEIKAVYKKNETQKPEETEIITDNNVEIVLPENLEENSVIRFTVVKKEGYSAFVYVNGVLTEEYSFVYHKGTAVEIKVDYKEFTVSDITAESYGHCAGDEYHLTFVTNDFARKFEITFADEALQNGFENLDYQDIITYGKQTALFNIPQNATPGKYTAYIRVKDNQGNQSRAFEFEFAVFYPNDIIETKYSDLICVNNSSKEYVGYQWIKNNHLITGATKQFFVDAPLLNGAYAVIVTKQNGEKIRVCNFDVKDMKLAKSSAVGVKVYPNPAKSGEKIFVEISGLTITSDTYILIYNQIGGFVERIDNVSTLNTITLKQGVYNGIIINGNKKHTFRIIVND